MQTYPVPMCAALLPLILAATSCGSSENPPEPEENPFKDDQGVFEVTRYELSGDSCDARADALESLGERTFMAAFSVRENDIPLLRFADCTSTTDCGTVISAGQQGLLASDERWITLSSVESDSQLLGEEAQGGIINEDGECSGRVFTTIRATTRDDGEVVLDIQHTSLMNTPLGTSGSCGVDFEVWQAEAAEADCSRRETFWLTPL